MRININDINCWIINLKPFDSNVDVNLIKDFQLNCVKHNVFGIGWHKDGFSGSLADNKDDFLKKCSDDNSYNAIKKATDNMNKIEKGDLVIMRLKNTHYYIGQVSEKAFYKNKVLDSKIFNERLSWMCKVNKWIEYSTDEFLPSEIIGRLSQRRQPTISRVANYRQKMLICSAFNNQYDEKIAGVSKINISIDNFARSLNYMELEDLVCSYIYKSIHTAYPEKNYVLLPSSCKTSRPLYEFIFVCPNEKPITCQVKNEAVIDLKQYDDDNYKKIYVFSDKGYANKDTKKPNTEIIEREKLYRLLIDNTGYMNSKLSIYYDFNGTGIDI